MKNTYILICFLFYGMLVNGQQHKETKTNDSNTIKAIATYTEGVGVELRWFPGNYTLYKMGINNGYLIERSEFNSKKKEYEPFKPFKTVFPYTKSKWNEVIRKNSKSKNNLRELAQEFYNISEGEKGRKIVFNGNTNALKERKNKEDNVFANITLMCFQDKEIAKGIGLGAIDNTVVKNNKYVYRIRLNTTNTALKDIKSYGTEVETIQMPAPVNKSIGIKEGDKKLTIYWKETPVLIGYYIERSERKNSSNYTPLNKAPLVYLKGKKYKGIRTGAFEDENLENGKEYYYKIYANDLFGNKLLVGEVKGTPKDLTPPKNPFLEIPKHHKDKVSLTWKFKGLPDADLNGFDVFRSDKSNGDYVKINSRRLPKDARTFDDENYSTEHSNYYKVVAYDKNNNSNASPPAYVVIIDDTPPAKPNGIIANINKEGVVQIVIPKQKDKDIIGFKVFKANQENHEFSVVKEVFSSDTDYLFNKNEKFVFEEKIPLKVLTPNIFYKIKMYDRNFNQSDFSDVIKIVKPDVVPPAPAIIKSVNINLNNIVLKLVKPSSKDLKEVNLYRKSEGSNWKLMHKFPNSNKEVNITYTDEKIEPNKQYFYRVQAVDINGLTSKFSHVIPVKTINFEVIDPVKSLKAIRKGKQVQISWKYRDKNKDLFFVIYRKWNDGALRQIGHSDKEIFVDKKPKKGRIQYAVKVMDKNGNSSKISETINL